MQRLQDTWALKILGDFIPMGWELVRWLSSAEGAYRNHPSNASVTKGANESSCVPLGFERPVGLQEVPTNCQGICARSVAISEGRLDLKGHPLLTGLFAHHTDVPLDHVSEILRAPKGFDVNKEL